MRDDKLFAPMRLQFFADGGEEGTGDDGQNNEQSAEGKDKPKTFTQEELDAIIEKRLAQERKKAQKKEQENGTKSSEEDKKAAADKAQSDKVSALEAKLLCFEHDVAKDSVSDVVALARAYVDEDTDFEEAIEKVVKKYPQFVKSTPSKKRDKDVDEEDDEEEEETENRSWGKRQSGNGKKIDGVEAAFLKRNQGLKVD